MEEILKKIEQQEKKIDAIYISVEKTRKYFQWTLIITIIAILLPLLAIVIVVPIFMGAIASGTNVTSGAAGTINMYQDLLK